MLTASPRGPLSSRCCSSVPHSPRERPHSNDNTGLWTLRPQSGFRNGKARQGPPGGRSRLCTHDGHFHEQRAGPRRDRSQRECGGALLEGQRTRVQVTLLFASSQQACTRQPPTVPGDGLPARLVAVSALPLTAVRILHPDQDGPPAAQPPAAAVTVGSPTFRRSSAAASQRTSHPLTGTEDALCAQTHARPPATATVPVSLGTAPPPPTGGQTIARAADPVRGALPRPTPTSCVTCRAASSRASSVSVGSTGSSQSACFSLGEVRGARFPSCKPCSWRQV